MTDYGWICLHRKSIKNPLFQKPLIWHYWQYCLLKANHAKQTIVWNKKEMLIEKGSFITGRKIAARETGLSEQNIRTAIDTLINLKMIFKSPKSTSKFTYLTICNYSKYQEKNNLTNQQLTSNQPATNQQLTTNNNDNNEKPLKTKGNCGKSKIQNFKNHALKKIASVNTEFEKHKETIIEFIEYRMSIKNKYKTDKGINGLFKDMETCNKAGYDIGKCLTLVMEKGWLAPNVEYFKNFPEVKNYKQEQKKKLYNENPYAD